MDFPIILADNLGLLNKFKELGTSPEVYNTGPFIMFDNHLENTGGFAIDRAYNIFDAGQFLWGQAMKRLGFSEGSALFYANLNEWYRLGDSEEDQNAIRWGYKYSIKTSESISHDVIQGARFHILLSSPATENEESN